jgi:hypothetical protein
MILRITMPSVGLHFARPFGISTRSLDRVIARAVLD